MAKLIVRLLHPRVLDTSWGRCLAHVVPDMAQTQAAPSLDTSCHLWISPFTFRGNDRCVARGMVHDGILTLTGTFTFLNTLTLHLLRLAPPLSYFRRRIRAGLFHKPTFGPPEREGPEGERRWQAAVAGAVGSLGLLWETQSRRTGVAQQ
jgi:hypothetical protein